ncbi:response regulator with -like aaa-type and dna-binding domains : Response regulator with CheY-like receiver, AAA-type ATPase, and DNA-binding domains OS=Singulisphaera acidiphila (strain ATCC BAA-1392 / DSM 18658 / VKM B-2454 / MOB10) GN=Sinac_1278 PE=4 SV=1: Response_reg: Sigma54_activat: HTH_8 [Gemmataceae bacterium]|nr:response regulator with -like aaa-type and dna-binding domains : Response regulator with CheY-like receiver, AAA-type ATPase, and DNA-binding domains OS=Singulisphaera acidiphila (strain ATCC BAA-1392 / DSM 18658 / VKM B-2454 / MOB10) GN=Sinac_1278 PE=4 SV=1: Response_reg: Sigma54_activat: HTH_8 [Gemmataceae bacterium]VTT96481.1 response regulator with -like aaa-type and dna-binding domains : Response regulator with CheY-like receiver, AAA-type ATPase, and DNA-binding domains OS=Singulisphaera 
MPTLLVIDDEPAIRHAFQKAFAAPIVVRTATTAAEGLAAVAAAAPDVVVLDVHLPDATGLDTFRRLRAIDARIPVILVTGHGTTDLAIQAMTEGVYEYALKPLELPDLRRLIDRALRSAELMRTPAAMPEVEPAPPAADVLLGRCPAMLEVYKAVGRVARQNVTVLVRGESGTGKELVARAVYQHSLRADKPFLAINCAALPENLLESELFGHEKGAFTGADRKRVGKFEQCSGGTLFLDEIGEMTPLTQAKVLRLVQEQRFERLGGTETVQTDVRLIAATNADLEQMVEDGRFRRDLYFRLNVFSVHLPPLRARGDDVGLLIDYYAKRFGRDLGKPGAEVAPAAAAALRAYPWPGNVRELQSVLKQALLRMSGGVLLPDFLPDAIQRAGGAPAEPQPPETVLGWDEFVRGRIDAGTQNLYAEALERMEREVLVRVLKHTDANQLQAARVLGITRGSLRNKIRALGITISREVWSDDDHGD